MDNKDDLKNQVMDLKDFPLLSSVVNSEIRIVVIEKILAHILSNNSALNKPTQSDVERFKKNAIIEIQNKYPNNDIKAK